jgi:hypothetical protein
MKMVLANPATIVTTSRAVARRSEVNQATMTANAGS